MFQRRNQSWKNSSIINFHYPSCSCCRPCRLCLVYFSNSIWFVFVVDVQQLVFVSLFFIIDLVFVFVLCIIDNIDLIRIFNLSFRLSVPNLNFLCPSPSTPLHGVCALSAGDVPLPRHSTVPGKCARSSVYLPNRGPSLPSLRYRHSSLTHTKPCVEKFPDN